jgi:excinuclease ABC subunit A
MTEKNPQWLSFIHATKHNLQKLSFRLPLQRFVCLSGVSGSGKSTLLDNVIYQGLLTQRHQLTDDPAVIEKIEGGRALSEIVLVDQSPLSRTPRSNPALYTEAWVLIRELFADTPAAQAAGFSPSSFSFNSGDGRCDHCQGLGYERVEMQFLSDVFVPCPVCDGSRFKPEVLAITWNGKSVADLLATSVSDALPLFAEHQKIQQRLAALAEVGLGYLTLGQPLNTLSGGEAQRLKLVKYLGSRFQVQGSRLLAAADVAPYEENFEPGTGNLEPRPEAALLLLDEPTTGLHRHDVKRLLGVLNALVERGHSVVVIEHNLDVLKSADWILEIGPEAGAAGGRIVAEGTPEDIAIADTATSPFLRAVLAEGSRFPVRSSKFQVQGSTLLAAKDIAGYETSLGHAAPNFEPETGNLEPRSSNRELSIIGARENNLQNLSLTIPHRQLTVVTGVSGSGKSTLAFDIVFAEGQRRFMESMSPYARQFVEQLARPAIDRLTGIPPTVAIEQRVTRGSRKSTVATITEVAQYLRLLYARLGVQHHPDTDRPVMPLSPGQLKKLLARLLASSPARRAKNLYLCAPLIRGRKGHHQPIATWVAKQGYELMRVDGRLLRVENFQKLDRYKEHDIEVVVADLKSSRFQVQGSKLANATLSRKPGTGNFPGAALDTALRLGRGSCFVLLPSGEALSWFSTTRTDIETGESFPEPDPKHFSFNSPKGWCPACRGHGRIFPWMLEPEDEDDEDPAAQLRVFGIESGDDVAEDGTPCPQCHGERLNRAARAVKLHFRGKRPPLSLPALLRCTPAQLLAHLRALELDARGRLITQDIVPQIGERLRFLDHVGLGYLALDRPTGTLSGGEAQRIRLAAQLGTNLAGVLYVLDEPSIGLHARDNDRLIDTLETLRDKGNTLLVVEHDDELMQRADHIIDLGPGAGLHGGRLLASGTPAHIKKIPSSLTGLYLQRGIQHPLRGEYRPIERWSELAPGRFQLVEADTPRHSWLEFTGVCFRNLKNLDLRLPLGRLVMVAGPSGAGKSTLFRDLLHPAVAHAIKAKKARLTGREFVKATGWSDNAQLSTLNPALSLPNGFQPPFAELRGANGFRSVVEVDQAPIGKTPRSTPATYLGIFDLIRQFFATLPEARMRGYTASRFSFNTAGGRCETCQGAGRIKLEMAFMPDAFLPCDACGGLRYGPELADIAWKGKNIGQVLQLTFEEAAQFFGFHARLGEVCRLMVDCGLGYLTLGQSSPTLSGGEAQRLKLVTELAHGLQSFKERSRGIQPRNLYLLEEPTIGLHLSDCEKLIRVLHSLVDQGHTVVVIEHHLDLLAEADWIVELGPDGGPDGGELIYQGPVAGLLKTKRSPTAPYLKAKIRKAKSLAPQLTVAVN